MLPSLAKQTEALLWVSPAAFVQAALEKRGLEELDRYLEQVEAHLTNLEDAAAMTQSELKALARKLDEHQARALQMDNAVDAFLLRGNEPAALAGQQRLNGLRPLMDSYQAQLSQHDLAYQELREMHAELEARHALLKQQRADLQSLLSLSRAGRPASGCPPLSLAEAKAHPDADIRRLAEGIGARLEKTAWMEQSRPSDQPPAPQAGFNPRLLAAQIQERKQRLALATLPMG